MNIAKEKILCSIMILSIPSRIEKYLLPLYNKLLKQSETYPDVEILCLMDNKKMSIGQKRQSLLDIARGKWVGFMDDDDDVSDDYISSLCEVMRSGDDPDVISFDQHCIVNGLEFIVNFSMNNSLERYIPGMTFVRRPPFHMCFWKNSIAKNAPFEDSSYGEDYAWCLKMYPQVKTEVHINKQLHLYRYSDATSESLQFLK